MPTMVPVPVADTAQMRRLIEFASDALHLADERADLDLRLLDRIADRIPELDLDRERVEWTTLDDGAEALIVNGGGFDGGDGAFFTNVGDDVHSVGSLDPLVPGKVGCIAIKPDGSRQLVAVMTDPLAQADE